MMDINPTDIYYFLEVASCLNMSRAAERLGVGQPTITQSMKRLESSLGVVLFDRFKTGVQLTQAGKRLVNQGQQFLDGFSKLRSEITKTNAEISGHYSLGSHASVALYSLPAFMKKLILDHPNLYLNLDHGLSREITEKVVSFNLDFGIVVNPVLNPNLIIRELCKDHVCLWGTDHSLENVLILDPSLTQSQKLLLKIGKKNNFNRRIESSSLEVAASLAASGCGIAILPEKVAKRFSNLKKFGTRSPTIDDRICLIYRSDRKLTASARAVIQSIISAEI